MDIEWTRRQEERKDVVEVAEDFNCVCGAMRNRVGDSGWKIVCVSSEAPRDRPEERIGRRSHLEGAA
jgi:hypothetical protein